MRDHPDFSPELFLHETRRNLLFLIERNNEIANAAQDALDAAVVAARSAGITWDDIGGLLGTTRQGAWKRFHRLIPHDSRIRDVGRYRPDTGLPDGPPGPPLERSAN